LAAEFFFACFSAGVFHFAFIHATEWLRGGGGASYRAKAFKPPPVFAPALHAELLSAYIVYELK